MTGEVVHSILEPTPEAVAQRFAEVPAACGLVEIRADRLRAMDVSGLVRRAPRPVIVAVRGPGDGGGFDGSTEEKRGILDAALTAGAAFVDVEWDGPLRRRADGADAARTILSHHGAPCERASLGSLFEAMGATKAARLKIVPRAARVPEAAAVRDLLATARRAGRSLACFAQGPSGVASRVFSVAWGSWGTYGAAERGRETAEGQPTSKDLLETYRVLELTEATQRFGLVGSPVLRSPSPALHAAAFRAAGIDGVYVPLDTAVLDDVAAVAGPDGLLRLAGFGVTVPLKITAAARCATLDAFAACGAVNTVVCGALWDGFNTDAPAALALIREHLEPRGAAVAVVGAGGTARAIAAALVGAGARVTLYSRTAERREVAARAAGAACAPLEALPEAAWDLLVQATPLGGAQEDVVPGRCLTGRMVLDAAYGPETTPLVRAARSRGLAVADGLDLLVAQAGPQFERLTGRRVSVEVLRAATAPWRMGSSA